MLNIIESRHILTQLSQAVVNRAIQKQLVRLPSQDPPPDETTFSSATLKVLRDAQSMQKDMVCALFQASLYHH